MRKQEGNIIWEVQDYRQPVLIAIYDIHGNLLESTEYRCMHEPIFGVDTYDAQEIDKILDRLIAKWNKLEEADGDENQK